MYVSSYATNSHLFPLPRKINPYHQIEIATARHAELLREQAQIERFVRTNPLYTDNLSVNTPFASAYERQVRQKQLRIAQMLTGDMSFALQQSGLRKKLIQQQLSYQSMLQQMEINRHYLLSSRKTSRLNSYKPNRHIFAPIENTSSNNIKYKNAIHEQDNKHHHKLNETFESVHIKDNSAKIDKKQKLLREYEKNSWRNHSEPKYNQAAKNEISQYHSFRENRPDTKLRQSLDLHNKRTRSDVGYKSQRKVMFDLASNIITTPQSQSQQNKNQFFNPKQPTSNNPKNQPSKQSNIKEAGQRKINNRIKLSQTIYRDSQLRNIKHELIHLINTYQNELKLRHALKLRINNQPKVIEKYNIVVQTL